MRSQIGSWGAPVVVALLLSACAGAPPQSTTAGDGQEAAPAAAADTAVPAPRPAAVAPAAVPETARVPDEDAAAVRPATTSGEGGTGAPARAPVSSAPAPSTHAGHAAPAPAPAAEIPTSPFVFVVAAGEKDRTHPFYGVGSKHGFTVNGVQGKPLVLVRGKTYTFKVDTGVQHDFYFSLSGAGWGSAAYTDGVEGQFIYKGVATFTPGADTPNVLYYACRNHKNMGGAIYVVNPGDENTPLAELEARVKSDSAGAASASTRTQAAVSKQQVEQKIQFADMFINQSDSAKRIKGSGNAEAVALYESARGQFDAARQAYGRSSYGEALGLVDDALRIMSDAARAIPNEAQMEGQRARFEELLRGTRDYEASYRRNYEHIVAKKGKGNIPAVDLDRIHQTTEQAQTLANDGQYPQAISLLSEAQNTLTTALTHLLDEESITYELAFETPKEEYEHELSRYLSYEELVPLAIEQKQPPKETVAMMDQLVNRAKEIKKLSEPEAAKGNYQEAILMLQGATDHVQRALRVVGVR
ncbi:MAG: hypothetical protein IT489_09545 [Gammaproteobacteria bacterium]|nr:hypothetical protein [Gammaproteobacteria bacterium]